jgi:hypothetical protein
MCIVYIEEDYWRSTGRLPIHCSIRTRNRVLNSVLTKRMHQVTPCPGELMYVLAVCSIPKAFLRLLSHIDFQWMLNAKLIDKIWCGIQASEPLENWLLVPWWLIPIVSDELFHFFRRTRSWIATSSDIWSQRLPPFASPNNSRWWDKQRNSGFALPING